MSGVLFTVLKFSTSFDTFTGSEVILSQNVYGELVVSCVTSGGCECDVLSLQNTPDISCCSEDA